MSRFQYTVSIVFILSFLAACNKKSGKIQRPRDPWAFRSVIDKQPRMLTLGLERLFKISGMPNGVKVSLKSHDSVFNLNANETTLLVNWFNALPAQFPPKPQEEYDAMGKYWMEKSDCFTCHEVDKPTVGPS